MLLMMFYTTVCGWMLAYTAKMAAGTFNGLDAAAVGNVFTNMLANPGEMVGWMLVVVVLGFVVCSFGLQKGVERVTKVMMVALLAVMALLVVRSVTLPGAAEGLEFYLVPDFGRMFEGGIAGFGEVVYAAMGQAFFTLSIGIGAMLIFGAYLPHGRSLFGEASTITALDTFVALMAGFIIIPACFAFGIQPDAGPSLIFLTIPNLFVQMPGGRFWGMLFFIFLSFAALSTVIAVFENIIAFGMNLYGWSRKKSVAVNGLAIVLLSIPCVLGFNLWSGFQPLGPGSSVLDLEDFIVSNNLLPLGSLAFVLFCTKKNGWGWKNFLAEANDGEGRNLPASLRNYLLYVLPLLIITIYLKGYYDMFSKQGPAVLAKWLVLAFLFLGFIFYTASRKKTQ